MEVLSHAYCDTCKEIQPVEAPEFTQPDVSGRFIGFEIVCTVCFTPLLAMFKPLPHPTASPPQQGSSRSL